MKKDDILIDIFYLLYESYDIAKKKSYLYEFF